LLRAFSAEPRCASRRAREPRINRELDDARKRAFAEQERMPKLRRDPKDGTAAGVDDAEMLPVPPHVVDGHDAKRGHDESRHENLKRNHCRPCQSIAGWPGRWLQSGLASSS
jgi:hypothetical protein